MVMEELPDSFRKQKAVAGKRFAATDSQEPLLPDYFLVSISLCRLYVRRFTEFKSKCPFSVVDNEPEKTIPHGGRGNGIFKGFVCHPSFQRQKYVPAVLSSGPIQSQALSLRAGLYSHAQLIGL